MYDVISKRIGTNLGKLQSSFRVVPRRHLGSHSWRRRREAAAEGSEGPDDLLELRDPAVHLRPVREAYGRLHRAEAQDLLP